MLAPRLPAMCGSATFAIEVSSTSMKAAKATVAAISHGFVRGFQRTVVPACWISAAGAVAAPEGGERCNSGKNFSFS